MRVFSYFENDRRLEPVEVETRLLPGLPQLKVLGLPDAHIKESALRIKSALTAQGFQWPRGHQVIVNLRPSHLKKQSRGLEAAMAISIVWATEQAKCSFDLSKQKIFIYGELGLAGEVRCPDDLEATPETECPAIIGNRTEKLYGEYFEIKRLSDLREPLAFIKNEGARQFVRPTPKEIFFSESVARLLKLIALSEASILLAGPPGTGKSTWAEALHTLLPDPDSLTWREIRSLHAAEGKKQIWRPFVNPHHTTPPISMIGGGTPPFPGEIAKAHGGLLLLDELLEFQPRVLEALREPIEAGQMRVARRGVHTIWPAKFQLVATTNLCSCGKLAPGVITNCGFSLRKCRSTWERLSGPMLDRFDVVAYTQDWNRGEKRISLDETLNELISLREQNEPECGEIPEALVDPVMSLRRRRAMARIARALATIDRSPKVCSKHWAEAYSVCCKPFDQFSQLFS